MKLMNLLSALVLGLGVVCIASAEPGGFTEADCTQRNAAGKCTTYFKNEGGVVRFCSAGDLCLKHS